MKLIIDLVIDEYFDEIAFHLPTKEGLQKRVSPK